MPAGRVFEPSGYGAADPAYFAVIVGSGTFTQTISLQPGSTYTLSFEEAPRAANDPPDAGVEITNAGVTLANVLTINPLPVTGSTTADFTRYTQTFTVPTILVGSSTLTLYNTTVTGSDSTEDYADLSVALAPEPSTWALLGLGAACLSLATLRRRWEHAD